ncbi:hypothetical protein BH23ACT10_BH23ACT10_16790 [soil metagenome]
MAADNATADDAPARDVGHSTLDTRVEAAPAWLFWGLTVLGMAVAGVGLYGIVVNQGTGVLDVRVRPMLIWTIGAVIVHDLIFAPLVLAVGSGLRWVRPRALRAPLQAALALTALVTLLAYPLIRGYGVRAGDPSRLPLNYTVGYAALVGCIWAGCAVWAWYRRRSDEQAADGAADA